MAENSNKKIATGALLAGLIGYVVGILTAPKSGKETRQDIKDSAVKAKKDAEKKLKQIHSELHSKLIDARKKADDLSGKAKQEIDKAITSASGAKERVREILSVLHEGDADDPDLKKAFKDAKEAIKNLEKYLKN